MTPRPTIGNRELLATCWTSAGDAAPDRGDEVSPVDLRTRIETAAEIGWEGFGLLHADLAMAERTLGLRELRRIFDGAGIEHVELEVLPWWWTTDERRRISDQRRTLLLEAAEVLGARTIKVAAEGGGLPVDPARFHDDFDRLATQAGNAGTRVALEPMPMTNLPTIQAGVDFVTEVGNRYGGLTVDIWHVHRGGTGYAQLERILPVEYLFIVELDDADEQVVGTLWEDTVNGRRLPGEGAFDVPAFIAAVHRAGYRGHWGVEIISEQHRQLPVREGLARARAATLQALAAAEDLVASAG
ncbi:sugar phosphate isomerase/epimerase [Geodermatophilus sp. YIM 151500]|uniref:sugar phosphate isomerase/epimerase family protein n=1 Tax=Geodermatophilus sp. YIM 151500 TaxID=2984531 RepID=UPI0021E4F5A3|nr:sugar phosphate isomerase/epimerase family protein [Geodermatophilus sp. YIM 151500]MCV2490274.1 sugar phosphate isomerase/epimerase [Geodermatophilus sp. YIM 151500]